MSDLQSLAETAKAWPFEQARALQKRLRNMEKQGKPKQGPVVFETGYGPSGLPHIGTFGEVVRTTMVKQAFDESGLPIDQIDWLVPHQANSRIAEAVRARLKVPHEKVIDLLANHGNTSSSSIPLSICKSYDQFEKGDTVGVCAFGGGFTFGAGVMTVE